MARDWVKLYTCLWEDEAFTELSNETLGMWTRMFSFAGTADDNGRTRTPSRLARLLCQPVEAIERAVAELDGRIVTDPDGVLRFRDWHDWQPQSTAERVRAHRNRAAEAQRAEAKANDPKRDVTQCNAPKRDEGHTVEAKARELRSEEETTPSAVAAQPKPKRPPVPRDGATAAPRGRDVLFDAFVVSFGFDATKPAPRIKGLAGDFSARCGRQHTVPTAGDWRSWVAARKQAGEWGKFVTSHNAAERFLAWWETKHPPPRDASADATNGHDPRFYVADGDGGYTLRHPALVDLPAPFNANDLTTWPSDMATVYADRLHDDGQGGRFFA